MILKISITPRSRSHRLLRRMPCGAGRYRVAAISRPALCGRAVSLADNVRRWDGGANAKEA